MKNLLVILFFIVPFFVAAQVSHTVQAKETLYSLARKYNVHPRELAAYNNISIESGLTVGQVVRIPAKTTMEPLPSSSNLPVKPETVVKKEETVKQATIANKTSGSFPVYHKVEKKETLYHISKLYDNVTIDDIKKWNNLTNDALSEGENLIVGYSGVKSSNDVAPTAPKTLPQEEPVKTAVVKTEPLKNVEPEKKEVIKTVEPEVKKDEPQNITGKDFKGGTFRYTFSQQTSGKQNLDIEKGTAGTFKSTSGWEDGKYYCLSNAVPAGTIVKVTAPVTQKSIFAKVLDQIPDLKQNQGIIIRLSNAAANELGVGEDNFECIINF